MKRLVVVRRNLPRLAKKPGIIQRVIFQALIQLCAAALMLLGSVFLSQASGGERVGFASQLFTISRDGRDIQRLTHGKAGHTAAEWAPGGRRIVTLSDGRNEVLTRSGRLLRTFAGGPTGTSEAHWSPSGRKLAFVTYHSSDPKASGRLITASVKNGQRRELARHVAGSPHWSSDGKEIYYLRGPGLLPGAGPAGRDLYSVPSKGGDPRKLVDNVRLFRGLSSDGEWLAFSRPGDEGAIDDQLWIARRDGSDQRMLAEHLDQPNWGWAPGNRGVYTVGYDGQRYRRRLVVISKTGKRRKPGAKIATRAFDWSPDGGRLAWGVDGATVRSSRPDGTDFRVLATIRAKVFAEIDAVAWSPDSRMLLVEAHRHDGD